MMTKNYRHEVFKQDDGKWTVEVFCNSDHLICYLGIDTQNDAHLLGEAIIEGIKIGEL